MLTAAALGLAGYGLYCVGAAILDLIWLSRLEWWAHLGGALLGLVLLFSAVLTRARVPGGLFFALGGLLGLQALNLHNSAHLHGTIQTIPEILRALVGIVLLLMARIGARAEDARVRRREEANPGPDTPGDESLE